jgi:hypothetical protein
MRPLRLSTAPAAPPIIDEPPPAKISLSVPSRAPNRSALRLFARGKAGVGRRAKAYDEASEGFRLGASGAAAASNAVEERAMKELVCRLFTRIATSLWGLALRRKPEAPPARPGPAISGAANRYWVAPTVKSGTRGQIWAVHRNDADTVATGLSLAQARTLCGLLNRLGGFAVSESRLSAGVKPPRIQSPDI